MSDIVQLQSALQKNAITLNDTEQSSLLKYLHLMQQWNKVYNLTAITDFEEMIYLHLIDSLMLLPFIHGKTCLDVGTGAGLPGIPLAIVRKDIDWTLLDKNQKKINFLTQVKAELQLNNVTVKKSRAEDYHPEDCFDTILSRALGSLNFFASITHHLLCPKGILIAQKGKLPEDEINEINRDLIVSNIRALQMKGRVLERHVIVLTRKGE